jgi:hypothetical protein
MPRLQSPSSHFATAGLIHCQMDSLAIHGANAVRSNMRSSSLSGCPKADAREAPGETRSIPGRCRPYLAAAPSPVVTDNGSVAETQLLRAAVRIRPAITAGHFSLKGDRSMTGDLFTAVESHQCPFVDAGPAGAIDRSGEQHMPASSPAYPRDMHCERIEPCPQRSLALSSFARRIIGRTPRGSVRHRPRQRAGFASALAVCRTSAGLDASTRRSGIDRALISIETTHHLC